MAEFRLGIQSWTFRNFKTLDELIGLLKKAGVKFVELFPGHLSRDADESTITAELEKFKDAGITVDSYGVCHFTTDEEANRKVLKFAKMAGIRAVSADIHPDAINLAEGLAGEYNVRLAIHNHGKKHRYGTVEQLKELFKKTGANVGLCLDTAWMMEAGGDPVKVARMFGERLYGVHLKDFKFNPDGSYQDVVLEEGNLNLEKFFQVLEAINFNGYLSIEYEGEPENPLPNVLKSVEKVRKVLG